MPVQIIGQALFYTHIIKNRMSILCLLLLCLRSCICLSQSFSPLPRNIDKTDGRRNFDVPSYWFCPVFK